MGVIGALRKVVVRPCCYDVCLSPLCRGFRCTPEAMMHRSIHLLFTLLPDLLWLVLRVGRQARQNKIVLIWALHPFVTAGVPRATSLSITNMS